MIIKNDMLVNQNNTILIVDDAQINRKMLSEILCDEYQLIEAENGETALNIINNKKKELCCILLDISMDGIDGFQVLEQLEKNSILNTIPVIIISSETSPEFIKKGYSLGAVDYINRPFDVEVVRRRVKNTINLYAKQKKLATMVIQKIKENERNNNMMIEILGHIVEFRNQESGNHVNNVSIISKIMLEKLLAKTNKYKLKDIDIANIARASALHDIGKISIPSSILNKPGKLTEDEFKIMKTHSLTGAQMLESITNYKNEPLVNTAYKICRWHHERYDGRGYPDGLVGDQIPIEAQVVSIADVYDALTSNRCYKKAIEHNQAIKMIMNNECGVFNPILLECLYDLQNIIPEILANSPNNIPIEYDIEIND